VPLRFGLFLLVNSVVYVCCVSSAAGAPSQVVSSRVSSELTSSQNSSDQKVLGTLEFRPSYRSLVGEFHSENSAILGYQFNKEVSLVYKQEFNTNLYDPNLGEDQGGLNAYLYDGYFKLKANNLYQQGRFSFNYEGRAYVPTWAVKRDAGMLTAIRNYAKLKYRVKTGLFLVAEEIPVAHLYQQAGTVTGAGKAVANPYFENRVSVGIEYAFSDKLRLSAPVLLSSTRTRAFSTRAANDDRWGHKVWINPELFYTVNANLVVGAGYYSENLVKSNFSETTLIDGFNKGTTQFIVGVNL
jgi:hypothetical protein